MSTRPRLLLFGVPTLVHDGQAQALAVERRSQLLLLLALKGGWVGRAELAAMLWPEHEPRLAATNLRKALFRLPALPWGRHVQVQSGALRFDGDTDVAAFEQALHDGRLDEALALRRGDLASGFDDDGNEPWTSWLGFERERLRVAWRGAALAWLGGEVSAPAALALSARLLEDDPHDETALAAHLRWLRASGQQAAATQVHRRFVERLASELGLEAGASLRALADAAPGDASPAAAAPAAITTAAGGAAPPLDSGFIGRGAELRGIASLLEQDDCRLVSLLGPGGIGKTRLARRALQELAQGFAQGTAFVALEDAANEQAAGEALARALAIGADGRADGRGGGLSAAIDALRGRQMLLALDNAETVAGIAALVQRLLQACPGLKLLVTSRTRLAVAEEWVFTLQGLPCPDDDDLDRVDAFDAVRLFERSARRVQPDFAAGAQAAAVATICRLVEGLPLALELAAAWVRVLPCADIAAELRRGTELLRASDDAQPARHASIEQVFEQSWQRLSDAERHALARLSVFRGGFDATTARRVVSTSLAVLAALGDKSLLQRDGERLRLHPLVQQLAAARLAADEAAAAAQAHAAHFLQLLAHLRPEAVSGTQAVLKRLDLEAENARAAWAWAATRGPAAAADGAPAQAQAALMAQAALTLMVHGDYRGHRLDSLGLGRWALDSPAVRRHRALRATLLAACAHLLQRLDRFAEAVSTANEALQLVDGRDKEHDDARDASLLALRALFGSCLRLGRVEDARSHAERALALAREVGDGYAMAIALGSLALVLAHLGHHDEAHGLALDSLRELRALGCVADELRCLNNLGDLELQMGLNEAAEAHLREGLALCERHGIRGTQGLLLANLSYAVEQRGDIDAAVAHARQALALIEPTGDRTSGTALRYQLVALERRLGRPQRAREELALAMRATLGFEHPALTLHGVLVAADLLAAEGSGAAAPLYRLIAAQPGCNALMRQELQQRGVSVPPATAPPALDLAQVTALIAAADAGGLERLARASAAG